jgi:Icc protein
VTIIVQISDMHVACPGDPFEDELDQAGRLATAVDWINGLTPRPDAVLATGDLVDHYRPEQYQRLREIMSRLQMPFWLMVGNHDHRDNLRAAFPEHAYMGTSGFLHYVIEDFPVRIIALDSQKTEFPEGEFCAERLQWLRDRLAEAPDKPTIVALHHPPFAGGIVQMDDHRLNGGRDEFAAILWENTQIERVIAGHIHRPMTATFGGCIAMSCPSTSHQIRLQIGRTDGIGIAAEPPGCLIHAWRPPDGLVSHAVPIGDFRVLADVDLRAHY